MALINRMKQGVTRVKQGYKAITGQTVEEQLTEFSEVYGEILLGLDREVENFHKKATKLQIATETAATRLRTHDDQIRKQEIEVGEQKEAIASVRLQVERIETSQEAILKVQHEGTAILETIRVEHTHSMEALGDSVNQLRRTQYELESRLQSLDRESVGLIEKLAVIEEQRERIQYHLERLEQLERSSQRTMRRTITIALVAAIMVTAALEGIFIWIRG